MLTYVAAQGFLPSQQLLEYKIDVNLNITSETDESCQFNTCYLAKVLAAGKMVVVCAADSGG